MPRTIRARFFFAGLIGVTMLPGSTRAQDLAGPTVVEVPVPGGIRRALSAINDGASPDRSQFLLEFIRRTYHTPLTVKSDRRDAALQALLAQLDVAVRHSLAPSSPLETLPLPLPAEIWIDVVFDGRATPQTLVSAILRSRNAALLYYGLLALDDGTRAWLGSERGLIADIVSDHAAAFVLAAPALRVTGKTVRLPGGQSAEPVWEALVGRRANQPAEFVRALLAQGEGRLSSFFGTMGQLTPAQLRLALNLASPDPGARVAAARRLHGIFERLAHGWTPDARTFWRPVLDPALLIAELRVEDGGRPPVPGTRRFWSAVFADEEHKRRKSNRLEKPDVLAVGDPVDVGWLCEQVFRGGPVDQRRRYQLVLFASRLLEEVRPETAADALEAVRAAGAYPALIAVLERSKGLDVRALASAARRAARLSAIEDDGHAVRALTQFQGTLAVVTRAALRGSLSSAALSTAVTSLSGVDVSERGDYEGRLVRWLTDWLVESAAESPAEPYAIAAGAVEEEVLRLLAGRASAQPRFVDWEGMRYRLDLPRAEGTRLARMLGDDPRPFLTSARDMVGLADALGRAGLTRERLRKDADVLQQLAQAVGWGDASWDGTDAPRRYRDAAASLQRLARDGDVFGAPRLAPALRVLADDLQARGLLELTYAIALGHSDRSTISAGDAARRHDFGLRAGLGRISDAWWLPVAAGDSVRGWHVTGSLLGLDVRLAEFSLVRLSAKPPLRRPTLNDEDRRVMIESVALVEPARLTDADRDAIAAAIRTGRARLAAVRTPVEAAALADEIRLSPARRTLLSWVVLHERDRVDVFLSPSELLWLGLEEKPVAPTLHAWGVPAEPRLGCLCLHLIDRRASETLAGRWNSGVFATGFPDLNLRLAELLADLRMPASLLGPVLASATLDFINNVNSRDYDDRRGPVEFVQGLRVERVEEYLALLTTDGPLVPMSDGEHAR